MVELYTAIVKQPDANQPTHPRVRNDPKMFPYFKDCLGAPDGTHIHAHVPDGDQVRYRNRKGDISQNVLGMCTFDELFCYVLPGWEGSAHDCFKLLWVMTLFRRLAATRS